MKKVQKGHVTLKWCVSFSLRFLHHYTMNNLGPLTWPVVGTLAGSLVFDQCGNDTVAESMPLCMWSSAIKVLNRSIDSEGRYIVDAADTEALPIASEELHALLEKPVLDGIPLLVLGNKSDLPNKLSVDELIDALDLKAVSHREVSCYGISAKEETNLDAVLQWLISKTSGK